MKQFLEYFDQDSKTSTKCLTNSLRFGYIIQICFYAFVIRDIQGDSTGDSLLLPLLFFGLLAGGLGFHWSFRYYFMSRVKLSSSSELTASLVNPIYLPNEVAWTESLSSIELRPSDTVCIADAIVEIKNASTNDFLLKNGTA